MVLGQVYYQLFELIDHSVSEGHFPCACLWEGTYLKRNMVQKMLWFSYISTKSYSLFHTSGNACSYFSA